MDWWTWATYLIQALLAFFIAMICGAVAYGVWREFRDSNEEWHRNSECPAWKAQQRQEDKPDGS